VHATRVAEKIGIDRVLVPVGAGVGSAIGFLRAPVGYELVKSLYQRFSSLDLEAMNALFAAMEAEAAATVAAGSFGAPTRQNRTAFMRYVGQGHEIPVPMPPRTLTPADVPAIRAEFDAAYTRFYHRPVPGSDVEILSFAVVIATVPDHAPLATSGGNGAAPIAPASRMVRDTATGTATEWTVHMRVALAPGAVVRGPAIIAENETSTLVGPGWQARTDASGYLELTRSAG
jgi:N-methylhydantoinase A